MPPCNTVSSLMKGISERLGSGPIYLKWKSQPTESNASKRIAASTFWKRSSLLITSLIWFTTEQGIPSCVNCATTEFASKSSNAFIASLNCFLSSSFAPNLNFGSFWISLRSCIVLAFIGSIFSLTLAGSGFVFTFPWFPCWPWPPCWPWFPQGAKSQSQSGQRQCWGK